MTYILPQKRTGIPHAGLLPVHQEMKMEPIGRRKHSMVKGAMGLHRNARQVRPLCVGTVLFSSPL